ncbi:hypothetical protein HY605_00855 [Candidatus Peregrinibacteria bacterium]|nr:hypothetical protein [Candidatus Peregrinibacteria bacterium]
MRKTSFILIIGILVLMGVGSYTGYVYWQKEKTAQELAAVKSTFADYQKQVSQKGNQNVLQAIAAKETVQDLKVDMVKWSKVIKDVKNTIPRKDSRAIVEVLTYSGSSNSDINMNVKTNAGSESPYLDVADLIQAFDENENFVDSFVPSISLAVNDDGQEVLSFLFSTKYLTQEDLGQALSEAISGLESETADSEKESSVISR